MKRSNKTVLAFMGIALAMAMWIWFGITYQLHSATITSLTGISLIIVRLVWICADGVDRGGRYGR